MQTIRLTTEIKAPVRRCFLLSLSLQLQMEAAEGSGERMVASDASSILVVGKTITWSAQPLRRAILRKLILDGWRPFSFYRESIVSGDFPRFQHERHFAAFNDGTRLRDELRFAAPPGLLGKLTEKVVLRRHFREVLLQRNLLLRQAAESENWGRYIGDDLPPELAAPAPPPAKTKPIAAWKSIRGW